MKVKVITIGIAVAMLSSEESAGAGEKKLSIDLFDQIKLESGQDQVVAVLGGPTKKFKVVEKGRATSEIWSYRVKTEMDGRAVDLDKIVLSFDSKTGRLIAKGFYPWEGEPESALANVQKRYPFIRLELEKPQWCGHYQPSERYHSDWSNGLSVVESSFHREVSSISWSLPEKRKPSSVPNRCRASAGYVEEISQ